ncbi:Defect at low temperature protein [Lachnellula occidentalis]|uniref:Defect at low temperature protein 1 n=1 Tax=Lachnellula occidentalis TaxID=215460 RepID=A0A8H8RXB8_9HELO|nr:Defect at low temperature protein [Lachnellula occidentalis]
MKAPSLFGAFYITFFFALGIALVALLFIPPADAFHQAIKNGQKWIAVVIVVGYAMTIAAAIFLYSSRLYTNNRVLQDIPKTYIPVDKGDVTKNVRKMVVASLTRSAVIAWDSRPRVSPLPATIVSAPEARDTIVKAPEPESEDKEGRGFLRRHLTQTEKEDPIVAIPPSSAVWGNIAHNGWASPASPDLPNLQYTTVILELPHLIEARAVSLAPPDPESTTEPALPDIRVVDLLQRPASMGLRDYIDHLVTIGVLTSPSTATDFLSTYEYARFGGRPLNEEQFRDLMKQFAEVLRTMSALSPAALSTLDIGADIDFDDDTSSSNTPVTPRSRSLASSRSLTSLSGSEGTIRTAPSRRVGTVASARRSELTTAPATPRSRKRVVSQSPSANSFAQSRRTWNVESGSSSSSLRSSSSVIKLSRTNENGELPYTLSIPGAR